MSRAMRQITVIEPPSLSDLRPSRALRTLPRFADLLLTLTAHRLKVRYKRSHLGVLWAVIQPLAMMLVFTLMWLVLGRAPAGEVPYALFAFSALVPWTAFAGGLSNATNSLTAHAALLTKVYFPREILPLTYVLAALVDFGLGSLALFAMMWWFGVPLSPTIVWSVPAILLLALHLTACSLLVAAVQVYHRDIGIAMPLLVQLWMFATPVIYPLNAVKAALPASLYQLYILNPMTGIVETFRRAVVLHQAPMFDALASSLIVTVVLLPLAFVYFKWLERTMADSI
jgi:lipopolysaccharide transport system permease protein